MTTTDQTSISGFDQAQRSLHCHESRVAAHRLLTQTAFLDVESIAFVHVETTDHPGRVRLTAFDAEGAWVCGDTVRHDGDQPMAIVPELSHYYTGLEVPRDSELDQHQDQGWIVNMSIMRDYDEADDRRRTQRAMVLAHLKDMMCQDDARFFLFGPDMLTPETGATPQDDAA